MPTWYDIKDQLERYGGEPHEALLEVLWRLTYVNDDLHHSRSNACIEEQVMKVTEALQDMLQPVK